MTPEQQVLWEIREQVAGLHEKDRMAVMVIAQTLRNILDVGEHAKMAFALVGAEEAAK